MKESSRANTGELDVADSGYVEVFFPYACTLGGFSWRIMQKKIWN